MATLALAGTLLVFLLSGCAPKSARMNVLLVTLDTTRADRLGCYGYEGGETPNLDALARDGVRFDLAIAQSAATPVSHASIFTGLNPYRHGLRVIFAATACRLPQTVPTLASILRDGGWQTAAFLSAFTVSEQFGLDRGFEHVDNGLAAGAEAAWEQERDGIWLWDLEANQRRADRTTDQAVVWLRRVKGPFLAWVHYWDPHDTMVLPPEEEVDRFVGDETDPQEKLRRTYDAEVHYVDTQFGRLVRALEARGLYENTLVVVVGDHGQGLGDHDWWGHRILYQEQLRVPLIFRIPGGERGRSVSRLVRTIDIMPTILEALDLQPPAPVQGRSLAALMQGGDDAARSAYADALNLFDLNARMARKRPLDALSYCAMDDEWKLIFRPRYPENSELFRIASDPREERNLYEQEPQQVSRLMAQLQAHGGFVDEPFGDAQDPAVLERLRSIGYVGD